MWKTVFKSEYSKTDQSVQKRMLDFQYNLLTAKIAKIQKPFLEPFFAHKPIEGSFDQSLVQADKKWAKN